MSNLISTPSPGQAVTANWKEHLPLTGFQFEILQGSSTVAPPIDLSPTQVDQESQQFVFIAPAFTGAFGLVLLENGGRESLTITTLVVSAVPTSSTQAPSNTDVPANQATTVTLDSSESSSSKLTATDTTSLQVSGESEPLRTTSSSKITATTTNTTSPRISGTLLTTDISSTVSGSTTSTTQLNSAPSKKEDKTIILGSILGAVIFLVILGLALFWIRRIRRRKQNLTRSAHPGSETTTSPDQLSAESERESPAMQGTLSPSIILHTDGAQTIERKGLGIVPNLRENTIGLHPQDAQQSDASTHAEEDIRFEEESVDKPPSYTSRCDRA
ncbi:hypothetical protein VKT23_018673 [Stygiomarasmius scandens]|uniref:Uncharacterized protein n=1 Tax=Marasmiellus scandens TaxID=2682957 RepID=A0ABR1IPZ6_9AGAR